MHYFFHWALFYWLRLIRLKCWAVKFGIVSTRTLCVSCQKIKMSLTFFCINLGHQSSDLISSHSESHCIFLLRGTLCQSLSSSHVSGSRGKFIASPLKTKNMSVTHDKTLTLSALIFDQCHIFVVQLAQFSLTFASDVI